MSFDYNSPIISRLRKGTQDDPFLPISETLTIDSNGKVDLTELPSLYDHITVTGDNKTWYEIQSGIPNESQFCVDYSGGKFVTFNIVNAGKQLQFDYVGVGLKYLPTSMIYTSSADGDVTETLKQLTDDTNAAKESTISTNTSIQNAENVRVENENTRLEQESLRETNTTNAISNLNNAVSSTKINWLSPVSLYTDIATTYPNPSNGDTTQVENDAPNNGTYRFNGTTWVKIQNPNGYANTSEVKKTFIGSTAPTDDSVFWIDESVQ